MGKFAYLILNLTFFLPLFFLAIYLYGPLLKRQFRFILAAATVGVIYSLVTDLIAIRIGAWTINYSKTIGINFKGAVLEELIWVVVIFVYVSMAIEVLIFKNSLHSNRED